MLAPQIMSAAAGISFPAFSARLLCEGAALLNSLSQTPQMRFPGISDSDAGWKTTMVNIDLKDV